MYHLLIVWFYFKNVASDFSNDIENNNDFEYFKYKAKLLKDTSADVTKAVLRDTTLAIPLK